MQRLALALIVAATSLTGCVVPHRAVYRGGGVSVDYSAPSAYVGYDASYEVQYDAPRRHYAPRRSQPVYCPPRRAQPVYHAPRRAQPVYCPPPRSQPVYRAPRHQQVRQEPVRRSHRGRRGSHVSATVSW